MARVDEPIHLSPYDPDWPKLFAAEARRVLDGQSTNTGIEHIGSTSVPGLLAKPIIDIMLGVDSDNRQDLQAVLIDQPFHFCHESDKQQQE